MPTFERAHALDHDRARAAVTTAVASAPGSGHGIGLEVEFFPVHVAAASRRVPLDPHPESPVALRTILADDLEAPARSRWLPPGVTLSVEPGGQLEVSTACCDSVDAVVAQATATIDRLAGLLAGHDVTLAAAGMDLWHDIGSVPQQLTVPRYPAMASYFQSRGPAGALMMRHTCALQLTLDLGPAGWVRDERWLVANLLAPVATATFATSPSRDGAVRSRRSVAWQQVDPTRTGFPRLLLEGRGTLEDQLLRAALDADVLLVQADTDPALDGPARAEPGLPGWRFADWVESGHPRFGWPTRDDLAGHLTTLFHEVRARGPIEIRSIDALPDPWRAVPVVLYAGALFDDTARGRIREVLQRHRASLPRLLSRAAHAGVSDPSLCALAVEVWSFALEGAQRLAGVGSEHLATVERFLDRYTLRGRCVADDIADRMAADPADALRWVSSPRHAATEPPR